MKLNLFKKESIEELYKQKARHYAHGYGNKGKKKYDCQFCQKEGR